MLSRDEALARLRSLQPDLQRRGVEHAYLFGSVARNEAAADSDVDIVVDLRTPLGFAFFTLEDWLSAAINARVELLTRAGMRPRVLAEAEKDLVRAF